jgi:triacylglycerol lipase
MVTRITRLLLLIQALIAVGLSALAIDLELTDNFGIALLAGTFCVLAVRFAIVTNNFILSWRYRSALPDEHRISLLTTCGMIIREYCSTMWSSSSTMPFSRFDRYVAAEPATLPVLLVHGYGCNSGYWRSMSKALAQASISHTAIDMEPVFGTIDAYVPAIRDAVERLCDESGTQQAVIVAHSMGGLSARAYLRDYGSDRIARVITLGTPHNGTALASFSLGENGRQMQWIREAAGGMASDWLQQLQQAEPAAMRKLFVSIYSHHDNIIAPQNSSHLTGAKNIALHGIGHVALALHPHVQQIVIDEITAASHAGTVPAVMTEQSHQPTCFSGMTASTR